jgi:hypothetical protein
VTPAAPGAATSHSPTRAILALTVGRCLSCLRLLPLPRGLVLCGATRCHDCRAGNLPVHPSLRRAA